MENKNTKAAKLLTYFNEYLTTCDASNQPFLLFDVANANENAHTNFLQRLLSIKTGSNGLLLDSFLSALGLPERKQNNNKYPTITTQKQAIGPTTVGYIDLYIEYCSVTNNTIKVIIENKVKEAGDCKHQLARYIATVCEKDKNQFKCWYDNASKGNWEKDVDLYVIYLSFSSEKEPSEDSLPPRLKESLGENYLHINYQDDILPWLESEYHKFPIGKDGTLASAIHQYIAYLNYYCLGTETWTPNKDNWTKIISGNDYDDYQSIGDALKKIKDDDNIYWRQFEKIVEQVREDIYAKDCEGILNDEWAIHFTPSFMCLYKKSWAAIDTRKYSIPSIYLLTSYSDFMNKTTQTWKFQIDHLTPDEQVREKSQKTQDKLYYKLGDKLGGRDKFSQSNHDKTAYWPINIDSLAIKEQPLGKMAKQQRQEYYTKLLQGYQELVENIDKAIQEVCN